jgi:hypothetical protein
MTPAKPPPEDGISDEALMMFADGTLDEATMEDLARAIEADPALEQRLAGFFATRDALKGAFSGVMNQKPPERLVSTIMAGPGATVVPFQPRAAQPQPARRTGWVPMAMAAGLAGFAAGLAGFLAGQNAAGPGSAVAALAAAQGTGLAALGAARDGEKVAFGADLAGSITGSYRMGNRRICRTLSVEHARSGSAAEGVACQSGDGWRIEMALPRDGASQAFRPATGTGPIDALLEAGGAGPALAASEVEALIGRQWR